MTLSDTCATARDWLCKPLLEGAQSGAEWLGQGQLGSRASEEVKTHKLLWLFHPRIQHLIFETRSLTGLKLASVLQESSVPASPVPAGIIGGCHWAFPGCWRAEARCSCSHTAGILPPRCITSPCHQFLVWGSIANIAKSVQEQEDQNEHL